MSAFARRAAAASVALTLGACATLEPQLPQAQPGVPAQFPATAAPPAGADAGATAWRDFLADPRLVQVVSRALEGNRDLRVTVLNVERARALHRIQRADRFPAVGAAGSLARSGGGDRESMSEYAVSLGVTAFEIDLFGRVRNLSEAALQSYFAQAENRRSAELALVAEVANAWLALAADRELLKIARATLANREEALKLALKRHELGAVSALDLAQARTAVEGARADAARYEGLAAADGNALALLAGSPVEEALLPKGWEGAVSRGNAVPANLASEALLSRPDIRAAEHGLRAANANIGAARAAFFPSITLTGAAGTAAGELSGLFKDGSFAWSVMPQVTIPIFQAGRLSANLDVAQADRDIALARYEQAIQAGFREVADALAISGTSAAQRKAQEALVDAAIDAERLSRARYDAGRDGYLGLLDAQRTLYGAQQGLVAARLAEQANRVALHKALGGGWKEAAK